MSLIANTKKQKATDEWLASWEPILRNLISLHSAIMRSHGLRVQLFELLDESEQQALLAEALPLVAQQWAKKDAGLQLDAVEVLGQSLEYAAAIMPKDASDLSQGVMTKNELIESLKDPE